MRRLPGAPAWLACALLIAACGATTGHPLAVGEHAAGPALGLRRHDDPARGALAYAVALSDRRLVSVELTVDVELVVRTLRSDGTSHELHRLRLGPADYDVDRLAVRGDRAYLASTDGTVRAIDLDSGREVFRLMLGDRATAVAPSTDGRLLVTGSAGGVLCLRRLPDRALLQCVVAHQQRVSDLVVRDGLVISASWDGTVAMWQLPSLELLRRVPVGGSANALALAPDGKRVAVARSPAPPVLELARRAAARGRDGIAIVDLASGRQRRLNGAAAPVIAVAWTPDGRRLLSGGWDQAVTLWDAGRDRAVARLGGFQHQIRGLAIGTDGRWLAIAAWATDRSGPAVTLAALLYP